MTCCRVYFLIDELITMLALQRMTKKHTSTENKAQEKLVEWYKYKMKHFFTHQTQPAWDLDAAAIDWWTLTLIDLLSCG